MLFANSRDVVFVNSRYAVLAAILYSKPAAEGAFGFRQHVVVARS